MTDRARVELPNPRSAWSVSTPTFAALLQHDDRGASREEGDPCREERQGFVDFRRQQSRADGRTQSQGCKKRGSSPENAMTHDEIVEG